MKPLTPLESELVGLLKQAVRYIEVTRVYTRAMTADEVEAAIPLEFEHICYISIGANSCNTLAKFDYDKAKKAIAHAEATEAPIFPESLTTGPLGVLTRHLQSEHNRVRADYCDGGAK